LRRPTHLIFIRRGAAARHARFFRAYSGSGLVIQRLARCQRIPKRSKVARIVSPLTRAAVSPRSKLTAAAHSRVQRLVACPKVRGLWCNRARSCSPRAASKATPKTLSELALGPHPAGGFHDILCAVAPVGQAGLPVSASDPSGQLRL